MNVDFHRNFLKNYKRRIAPDNKLVKKFEEKLRVFRENPDHALLRNHKLTGGGRERWSFSVTGDIRAIYFKTGEDVLFYDIGSHNQVYQS